MSRVLRVDEKGRILIPKNIREKVELKKGSYASVKVDGKTIVIEPLESVADKYFGAFKISRWPKDIDEFMAEVMGRWWITRDT